MERTFFVALIAVVIAAGSARAEDERIENVGFQIQGNKVLVFYDLLGDKPYDVSLRLLTQDGAPVALTPRSLFGDVGDGILPGKGKEILWDVLRDTGALTGDNFVFEIKATRKTGTSKWLWLVGIGAIGGAVAATQFPPGDKDNPSEIVLEIPDPESGK